MLRKQVQKLFNQLSARAWVKAVDWWWKRQMNKTLIKWATRLLKIGNRGWNSRKVAKREKMFPLWRISLTGTGGGRVIPVTLMIFSCKLHRCLQAFISLGLFFLFDERVAFSDQQCLPNVEKKMEDVCQQQCSINFGSTRHVYSLLLKVKWKGNNQNNYFHSVELTLRVVLWQWTHLTAIETVMT